MPTRRVLLALAIVIVGGVLSVLAGEGMRRFVAAPQAAAPAAAESAAVNAAPAPAALRAGAFEPARLAPDFTLQGSDGKPLQLSAHRGKVVLLGFGYSSCSAVCPVTLATLKQAYAQLGAEAAQVQVVYVTVDPTRDDAARLGEYLAHFDTRFLGGTGSEAELATVRDLYGITATGTPGPDGAINHSSFVYLIDRQGRLRALMPYGRSPADYLHDVRLLLADA